MGLVTISDLHTQPAEEVASIFQCISDLSIMYHNFIENDEDDVAFVAGWQGAKARSGGIHASEISGECRRPAWYSLQGIPRQDVKIPPFWKKKFRVGHMYHAMVQEDWRRLCEKSNGQLSCQREVTISPSLQAVAAQYDIHSSCDLVIGIHEYPWGPLAARVGVEIKTESHEQFAKLQAPKPEHLRQTCVYMKCLDVPVMWTMYCNKGNQNIVPSEPPYLFTFDHALWDVIEGETQEVIRQAQTGEEPTRCEGIQCQFCGYAWICKPDSLARKRAFEELAIQKKTRQKRARRHGPSGLRAPKAAA